MKVSDPESEDFKKFARKLGMSESQATRKSRKVFKEIIERCENGYRIQVVKEGEMPIELIIL